MNSPNLPDKLVLVLTPLVTPSGGGLQSAVSDLLKALESTQQFGYRIVSVVERHEKIDRAQWGMTVPEQYPYHGPGSFRYSPGMRAEAFRAGAACVHVHGIWTFSSMVGSQLARRGTPTIVSPHGMLDPWIVQRNRWKKTIALAGWERANLRHARVIRALNEAEAACVRPMAGNTPIAVIPNGVELPELAQASDDSAKDSTTFLYLGRLHEKKGVHDLVLAWPLALQRHPGHTMRLRICGYGEPAYVERCRRLASELGVSATVEFVGPVFGDAKTRELSTCSALVLPSFSEGLPMTILEAWSHAKPTLISRECNLPEGIAAGCATELPHDRVTMATALADFASLTMSERQARGRAGRRLVESAYSWADVASRFDELTRWAIDGGPRPSSLL